MVRDVCRGLLAESGGLFALSVTLAVLGEHQRDPERDQHHEHDHDDDDGGHVHLFRPSLGPRMRATERVYPRGGGAEPPRGVAGAAASYHGTVVITPFPSDIWLGKGQVG